METLEEKIRNKVSETLNSGAIEELVGKCVEKCISDALGDIFSYRGQGYGLVKEKLNEAIVPAIELFDFGRYVIKLDSVLTDIVNHTNLIDNKKILENFSELMKSPQSNEVKLSEIFKQYCRYVAEKVDTGDLEACCDDGEVFYEHVSARMEVDHEDKRW